MKVFYTYTYKINYFSISILLDIISRIQMFIYNLIIICKFLLCLSLVRSEKEYGMSSLRLGSNEIQIESLAIAAV